MAEEPARANTGGKCVPEAGSAGAADSDPWEPSAEVGLYPKVDGTNEQWLARDGLADIVTPRSRTGIYKEEESSWGYIRGQAGPGC